MSPSFTFTSTLKTKAKFKMLVTIYQTICCHNQGDQNVKPSGLIAQIRDCVSRVQFGQQHCVKYLSWLQTTNNY